MVRIIIAALLGGAACFVWGFVSWTILEWHGATIHDLPSEETAIVSALETSGAETGTYMFPGGMPREQEGPDFEAWKEKYEGGPIGLLFYQKEGDEAMSPIAMAQGFGLNAAAAVIAALLLFVSGAARLGYFRRVLTIALTGASVALVADLAMWNWMPIPLDWTLVQATDHLIFFLILGITVSIPIATSDSSKKQKGSAN